MNVNTVCQAKNNNRDLTWDAIKGVAILLMVIGHSGCPNYLGTFIFLFHMGLFYYASGHFFKPHGIGSFLPFLRKKVTGLYRPYVLWGGVFLLLHNVFYSVGWYTDEYSIGDTIEMLVKIVSFRQTECLLSPLWFLTSLFKGLVITYIVCLFPQKKIQWMFVIMLYLFAWISRENEIWLSWYLNRDMGIVIAIFLGYKLKDFCLLQSKWCFVASVILLLSSCFWVRIDVMNGCFGHGMFPIVTLAGVVFIKNIVSVCKQKSEFCYRLFVWLGRNSLHVLIFHLSGFHLLSQVMLCFGIGDPASLSNWGILDGINHNVWFIPYTLAGVLLAFVYVEVKASLLKYYTRFSGEMC